MFRSISLSEPTDPAVLGGGSIRPSCSLVSVPLSLPSSAYLSRIHLFLFIVVKYGMTFWGTYINVKRSKYTITLSVHNNTLTNYRMLLYDLEYR